MHAKKNTPQSWKDCDDDIKSYLHRVVDELKRLLGEDLTGVYLYGSLAMGSYYRPKSDFDLVVVVSKSLESSAAKRVALVLAHLAEKRPTTGNLELSIITAAVAKVVPVPTPYEVHYSTAWHDRILDDQVDYSHPRTDGDLLASITYVVERGVRIFGRPISETFGNPNWSHFMGSVMDDFEWIVEGENLLQTPFYGVLNICRVLQLLNEKAHRVHSKDEGGEWALVNVPVEFRPVIIKALEVYRSGEPIDEARRRTGGKSWDKDGLLAFRDYAKSCVDRTNA